ncbi:hypothetical protein V8C86DRAFT_674797 [Haematococcus lacustris]
MLTIWAEGFRKLPLKKGQEEKYERRVLGLLILRGKEVISGTIEGPPPADHLPAEGLCGQAGPHQAWV